MNNNSYIRLSVIIPVFNAINHIENCIHTILNQIEKNFEILLIDDGSTDGTGEKCDNISNLDSRIRVFHKKNGGVSSARNIGLDNARGEWIAFIDADDEVSNEYLSIPEELHDYDVILKSFIERTNEGDLEYKVSPVKYLDSKSIERWFIQRRNNALWDKIIRRNIIGEIRFDTTISIGEDLLFFANVLPNVSSITTCNVGSYIYIRRQSSAMSQLNVYSRIEHDIIIITRLLNINRSTNGHKLGNSVAAKHYIPRVRHYLKYLNKEQRNIFKVFFNQLNIYSLPYLTVKDYLRYLYTLWLFKIKSRIV